MIGASQAVGRVRGLSDETGPPVRADVVKYAHFSVLISHHEQRPSGDLDRLDVAGLRDVALRCREGPAAGKHMLVLEPEELARGEGRVRQASSERGVPIQLRHDHVGYLRVGTGTVAHRHSPENPARLTAASVAREPFGMHLCSEEFRGASPGHTNQIGCARRSRLKPRSWLKRSGALAVGLALVAAPVVRAQSRGILGQRAPSLSVDYWIDAAGESTRFDLEDATGKWVYLKCFQS